MTPLPNQSDGDRETCRPCRGQGKLISNLGGQTHEVTCPWCEGTGRFKAEHDAQEHLPEVPGAPGETAPQAAP